MAREPTTPLAEDRAKGFTNLGTSRFEKGWEEFERHPLTRAFEPERGLGQQLHAVAFDEMTEDLRDRRPTDRSGLRWRRACGVPVA
jgi:hypothetical protein